MTQNPIPTYGQQT